MALLHLLHGWAHRTGATLCAVTVDHGLRPAARAEAAMVAEVCEGSGIDHTTLLWEGWDGTGNLQDQARRARYALMSDWAQAANLGAVAIGHTADDQAETFLMRLTRGAGVDGLSGMAPRRRSFGVDWLRPLLGVMRADLRAYLAARRLGWVDDPSNANPQFARVRARQLLEVLAPLGLDAAALRATTLRLAEARDALDLAAQEAARRIATVEAGDVKMERAGFLALPAELRRRLLSHALAWVASAEYRPRHDALAEALAAVAEGRDMSLHGCLLVVRRTHLRLTRELQAVKGKTAAPGAIWDRRWRLTAPEGTPTEGMKIAALGEAGLAACPKWRETGLKRSTLLAAPGVWRGADLVAAPLAGQPSGWSAELARGESDYFSSLLSH
ncbi:MAG: tRNA lysidine(34) synthetase TilS [Rhodobacteraceae bacterium]|nr:tRNA lysidine(34) synthetase TilS [Paracoccaceae bacterium]